MRTRLIACGLPRPSSAVRYGFSVADRTLIVAAVFYLKVDIELEPMFQLGSDFFDLPRASTSSRIWLR
jgi:hypothetical protein